MPTEEPAARPPRRRWCAVVAVLLVAAAVVAAVNFARTGTPQPTFAKAWVRGHSGSVGALRISADQRLLVSGAEDGEVKLWRLPSLEPVWARDLGEEVQAVAISSDAMRVAAGQGGRIRILDGRTGEILHDMEAGGGANTMYSLVFSPDGTRLLADCTYADRMVDVAKGDCRELASSDLSRFSADGSKALGGTGYLDLASGEWHRYAAASLRGVGTGTPSADGAWTLWTGTGDSSAFVVDAGSGEVVRAIPRSEFSATRFAAKADLIIGWKGDMLGLWPREKGDPVRRRSFGTTEWTAVDVSPDGDSFVFGVKGGEIGVASWE